AVLARVTGAADDGGPAIDGPFDEVVVGDPVEVHVHQPGEDGRGGRPLEREQGGLLGAVHDLDAEAVRELADPVPDLRGVRGIHHQPVTVREAVDEAVVQDAAVLLADRRVVGLAHVELRGVVRGDELDEAERVIAPDLELAHVRDVEQTGARAHGLVLGDDAGRILNGHFEAGERHELRAGLPVLLEKRGALEFLGHAALHSAQPPMRRIMIAFCTWRRFSASSKTRDRGPSITSSATSSPRCAGRQCRKIARSAASPMSASSTWKPRNARRRTSTSSSWPMDAQTSVVTTSAPSTASRGSCVSSTFAAVRARSKISRSGSYPGGHAIRSSRPKRYAAFSQEFAMLLPSPTHATFTPVRSGPNSSWIVKTSASTWQGCSRSVRP